ncbi:50S ribosomal protein bL37 [Adhaeretor mobilis]
MAKPGRKVKKANHGKRPACSRPRKSRRQKVKT